MTGAELCDELSILSNRSDRRAVMTLLKRYGCTVTANAVEKLQSQLNVDVSADLGTAVTPLGVDQEPLSVIRMRIKLCGLQGRSTLNGAMVTSIDAATKTRQLGSDMATSSTMRLLFTPELNDGDASVDNRATARDHSSCDLISLYLGPDKPELYENNTIRLREFITRHRVATADGSCKIAFDCDGCWVTLTVFGVCDKALTTAAAGSQDKCLWCNFDRTAEDDDAPIVDDDGDHGHAFVEPTIRYLSLPASAMLIDLMHASKCMVNHILCCARNRGGDVGQSVSSTRHRDVDNANRLAAANSRLTAARVSKQLDATSYPKLSGGDCDRLLAVDDMGITMLERTVVVLVGSNADQWRVLCRSWLTIYKYAHEHAEALRPELVDENGDHFDAFTAAISQLASSWSATCGVLTRYAHDVIVHLRYMMRIVALLGLTLGVVDMQVVEYSNLVVRRNLSRTVSKLAEGIVSVPLVKITDEQLATPKRQLKAHAKKLGIAVGGTAVELAGRINAETKRQTIALEQRRNPANHRRLPVFITMNRLATANMQRHRNRQRHAAAAAATTAAATRKRKPATSTTLPVKRRRRDSGLSFEIVELPPVLPDDVNECAADTDVDSAIPHELERD